VCHTIVMCATAIRSCSLNPFEGYVSCWINAAIQCFRVTNPQTSNEFVNDFNLLMGFAEELRKCLIHPENKNLLHRDIIKFTEWLCKNNNKKFVVHLKKAEWELVKGKSNQKALFMALVAILDATINDASADCIEITCEENSGEKSAAKRNAGWVSSSQKRLTAKAYKFLGPKFQKALEIDLSCEFHLNLSETNATEGKFLCFLHQFGVLCDADAPLQKYQDCLDVFDKCCIDAPENKETEEKLRNEKTELLDGWLKADFGNTRHVREALLSPRLGKFFNGLRFERTNAKETKCMKFVPVSGCLMQLDASEDLKRKVMWFKTIVLIYGFWKNQFESQHDRWKKYIFYVVVGNEESFDVGEFEQGLKKLIKDVSSTTSTTTKEWSSVVSSLNLDCVGGSEEVRKLFKKDVTKKKTNVFLAVCHNAVSCEACCKDLHSKCVRPSHLKYGRHAENMKDSQLNEDMQWGLYFDALQKKVARQENIDETPSPAKKKFHRQCNEGNSTVKEEDSEDESCTADLIHLIQKMTLEEKIKLRNDLGSHLPLDPPSSPSSTPVKNM
jgi:hypothetical protein